MVGQSHVPCFTICATAASSSSSPCSIESHPPSSARFNPGFAVRVARDLLPPAVHLVHDGLQLLHRQRRLRLEVARPVQPRAVGHVHLDPVGPVLQLLARRLPRLHRSVDELRSLRDRHLRRVSLEVVAAGRRDGPRSRRTSAAPGCALLDRPLDAHVAVAGALGLDVTDGREALLERAARRHRRARSTVGEGILEQLHVVPARGGLLALQEDVGVRVDHSRAAPSPQRGRSPSPRPAPLPCPRSRSGCPG